MTKTWVNSEQPFPIELIGSMNPAELLYEFDWPITFTFQSPLGLLLAHLVTVESGIRSHVVVPVKAKTIDELKSGACSVRAALDQPLVWFVSCDSKWKTTSAVTVPGISKFSADAIPDDGAMLYPDLEPLIRVRLKGVLHEYGRINADVIRSLVVRVQKSLRGLAKVAAMQQVSVKQNIGAISELLTLQTQQVRFASLEIAFRESDREAVEARASSEADVDAAYVTMDRMRQLLEKGLSWTIQESTTDTPAGESAEMQAILESLRQLVPNAGEDEVELSGRLVEREAANPLKLVKKDAIKINRTLKRLRQTKPRPVSASGIIEELDVGRFTFTVRSATSTAEHRIRYGKSQEELVRKAFNDATFVTVDGTQKLGSQIIDLVSISAS